MPERSKEDGLEKQIAWRKTPEPPVPGLYCMDMVPNIDTRAHDPSLDAAYRRIHTPFLEFFPADILKEMRGVCESAREPWLRQDEQIDCLYYREQSDRRDCIKRDETKQHIEDVKDYQKHVRDTFADIDTPLSGYEIVEEYPLFPSQASDLVLANGSIGNGQSFVNEGGESTLVDLCVIDGKKYECVKQSSLDNIVIEIKDSKAYYSVVSYVYKFKEAG